MYYQDASSLLTLTSSVSAVLPFQRPNGIAFVPGKDIAYFRGNFNLIYDTDIAYYFWNNYKIIV